MCVCVCVCVCVYVDQPSATELCTLPTSSLNKQNCQWHNTRDAPKVFKRLLVIRGTRQKIAL